MVSQKQNLLRSETCPSVNQKIKLDNLAGYDTHKTLLRKIISGNDCGIIVIL